MKVYVMTDLDCVAGVVSLLEYCLPPDNKYGFRGCGKYYEHAKELATMEVNAAVDGLLESGATEILVCDGHGPGGLNASSIHPQARILSGKGKSQPLGLDRSFDAALMIGQHAMADTNGGHHCHSGSLARAEWLLNGELIGEIGLFMLACSYFNVPVVMISGDAAACEEARLLTPSIEAVAVIEGQERGSTKGMGTQKAIDLNVPAIHASPVKSREMIKQGARSCLSRIGSIERIWVDPPYEMVRITRPNEEGMIRRATNRAEDFIDLISQPTQYEECMSDELSP